MTGGGGLGGCVRWSAMAEDPDLVFYCPFCAKAAKKPCVVSTECPSHTFIAKPTLAVSTDTGSPPQIVCLLSMRFACVNHIHNMAWNGGPLCPNIVRCASQVVPGSRGFGRYPPYSQPMAGTDL